MTKLIRVVRRYRHALVVLAFAASVASDLIPLIVPAQAMVNDTPSAIYADMGWFWGTFSVLGWYFERACGCAAQLR